MRINALLPITIALGLAACQPAPVLTQPIPQPDPTPIASPSDTPGSSAATATSLTMLTSDPNEKQGEQLPLITSNAEWVAFQDGTGPWKKLEGTNGAYPFEVTNKAGKYGLAYTCPKPAGSTSDRLPVLEMRLFTLADLAAPRFGCNVAYTGRPPGWTPPPSTTTFKLSGKVTGLETSETATALAFSSPSGTGINVGADGTFSQSFPQGKYNIMVGKTDKPAAGSTNPPSIKFKKIIFERDLNLGADTARNFDFATQGFSPVAKTVSFTGIQAGEQGYINPIMIVGGSYVYLNSFTGTGVSSEFSSGPIDVFPENQLQAGDSYGMQLFVNGKQGRDTSSRGFINTSPTFISSFALPPLLTLQVTSEAPTPYVRPKVTLDQSLSNTGLVAIRLNEDVYDASARIINQRSWSVFASGSWLGAKPSFTAPDFSALTGWNTSLEFKNLNDLGWVVICSDGNAKLRFQRASLFNDDVARREYTAAEFTRDSQNITMNISSINHPTADKIKPFVTNTVPSDIGFSGTANIALTNTKNLEIQFNEEMNPTSVLAAYESTSLPANSVTFSWKTATSGQAYGQPNSVLVITPNATLTVGSTYSFTLGAAAKDISENSLIAKTFSFKVIP